MRKALSFVLVLALIMGSFSFAFAADTDNGYSDVAGKKCEGAVTVLSALDVVSGYPDGTYKPEKVVTRAEMAKLLIVALGMEEYVAGTYTSFSDVGNHWANSYIAYAASMGIIEGYPDGTFRPDNTVTYQEAITMVVRALGYQDQYLTGTWPASHVSMAKALGILDDIVATAAGANRGDVAILIYNAIALPTVTYTTNGALDQTGKSMLVRLGAADRGEAILCADGAAFKDKNNGLEVKYDFADGVDLSKFYGFYATIYTIEDDNDDDVIVAVGDIKGTAYEVELTKDATDSAKAEFTYDGNDYAYNAGFTKIINNEISSDEDLEFGKDKNKATVIVDGSLSKKDTDLYSIIQWKVDAAVQLTDDDIDGFVDKDDIADFAGSQKKLVYDDDDEAYDVIVDGDVTALADLAEDDVVFIYADAKNNIVKITAARKVVEGEITRTSSTAYKVDGVEYKVTLYSKNAALGGLAAEAVVGDSWKFTLDPDGRIFVAEESGANVGDYCVALGYAYETSKYSENDRTYYLKVLDNAGVATELKVDDKVGLIAYNKDGKKAAKVTKTDVALAELIGTGDIIAYSTDSKGLVTDIETYAYANDDATNSKMSKKGVFEGATASEKTVVFTFDNKKWTGTDFFTNDEDDYDVSSFKAIAGEDNIVSFYVVNDDKDIVAMLISDGTVGSNVDNFGVINERFNAVNSDDDKIYELDTIVNGAAKTFFTDDDGDDFDGKLSDVNGGIFALTTDNEGIVTGIEKLAVANADTDAARDAAIANVGGYLFGNGKFTVVESKTAGIIEIGETGNTDKYDLADDVVVYKMAFDDDAFDCYEVGTLSNVTKNSYVILADVTDDDEYEVNVILVVTRADYNDNKAYLDRAWTPAP